MPAGNTYEAIATQTLGSAAASVTFSSIPGTYTDLVLVVNATTASASDYYLRINGDTGPTTYSETIIYGTGSSVVSVRYSNYDRWNLDYLGLTATTINMNTILQIQNYSNTTTYKTGLWRENNASAGTEAHVGLWRSTSAITSLNVFSGANFVVGSSFSLYGIKAA